MVHARDIAIDFNEGRLSLEELLQMGRSYQEPAEHFLHDGLPFYYFLTEVSEERLCDFLEALIAENPRVLAIAPREGGSLLHQALSVSESRRVQLLLAVPEATRLLDGTRSTPLHVACEGRRIDPDVTNHLINLDPDVLTHRDDRNRVPLHYALRGDPSSAHASRMIKLKPETLIFQDNVGHTPFSFAMELPFHIVALRHLVARHPRIVALPEAALPKATVLMRSCEIGCSELSRAFLEAHPPSLVIPDRRTWDPIAWLPFEAADEGDFRGERKFVWVETVHMALAVVEYVLGVSFVAGDVNVAWFRDHVMATLKELVPGVKASGLSVAQALRRLDNNDSSSIIVALVRAWFCHDGVFELLRGEGRLLRNVVLCDTVVDLFRLNRQGRYRPVVQPPLQDAAAIDLDWFDSDDDEDDDSMVDRYRMNRRRRYRLTGLSLDRLTRVIRNPVQPQDLFASPDDYFFLMDLYRRNLENDVSEEEDDRSDSSVIVQPPLQGDNNDDGDDDDDDSSAVAAHQIQLLASLGDSETVESTYLHFREVAHHALLVHWRRRRLAED